MCSSIHKGKTLNQQGTLSNISKNCCSLPFTTAVPAERVLEMATVNGAKALLWDNEIGSLKPGMKADIVVVNPNTANMLVCRSRYLTQSHTNSFHSHFTMLLQILFLVCKQGTLKVS